MASHRAGRLTEAEALYLRVLQVQPRNFEALRLFAVLSLQRGKPSEALRLIGRSLEMNPAYAAAWHDRGQILRALGRNDEALECYARALAIDPAFVDAIASRGQTFGALGRNGEALACFDAMVAAAPGSAQALNNRGSALAALKRYSDALSDYDKALSLQPRSTAILNNRGLALQALGRDQEALAAFERALILDPTDARTHNNRGLALQGLDRHENAVGCFDQALALQPGYADAWNHRAASLQELRRFKDALESYERAIALAPEESWFHWNLGLLLLLLGDFERGWPEYEWRLRTGQVVLQRFQQPLWRGEPLNGRTLLIHTEQGLGDTIQFCRYAPQFAREGRVILQAPGPLLGLLERLALPSRKGVGGWGANLDIAGATPPRNSLPQGDGERVAVVPTGDPLPNFDLQCPLLSLAGMKRTASNVPYLFADPNRVADWREKIGGEGLKIGICWQGNPAVGIDRRRSIPLRHFQAIGRIPGVRLISLQRVYGLDQLTTAPPELRIETLDAQGYESFDDAAAIMMCLDLVVSSDTAIAHVAGALGRPVWLGTSYVPDWRWGLEGSACDWYPTMRLFRQTTRGDWLSVFAEMAAALRG
ncbi:MAG: tetratricopeptide repeat protein [Acetobacteraceae bacterium]|nr:tetratricopeptide repeat protein [Acetobacteraceae bacterium]